jgi:hypothetical protein
VDRAGFVAGTPGAVAGEGADGRATTTSRQPDGNGSERRLQAVGTEGKQVVEAPGVEIVFGYRQLRPVASHNVPIGVAP